MSIRRLHTEISKGLQRVDSHREDWFLPEEIDLFLYKNALRLIKEKYQPMANKYGQGFEDSRKRLQDLRTLVVQNQPVDLFYNGDNKYIGTLPYDFMFYESIHYDVQYHQNKKPVPSSTQEVDKYIAQIKIPTVGYDHFSNVNVTGGIPDLSTSVKDSLNGLSVVENIEYLAFQIIDFYNNNTNIEAYFESYYHIYNPGTIIFVADEATNNMSLHLSDEDNITEVSVFRHTVFNTKSTDSDLVKSDKGEGVVGRTEAFNRLINDPYYSPSREEVPTFFSEGSFTVSADSDFILNKGYLSYVKRPRVFSYQLDTHVPFPRDIESELIDMTVSDMLESTGSPRFQSHMVQEQRKE